MEAIADLRSDTLTKPTEAMLEAMGKATSGDDSADGDPTVRHLEEMGCALTGKEAALFMPSGTMTNLVAALTHAARRSNGEVITESSAHMARSEYGGLSRLGGLFCTCLPARDGELDRLALSENLRSDYGPKGMPSSFVLVETTHNCAGGKVPSLDYMRFVREKTAEKGVAVHIDGARLFNAAVALGVSVKEIASYGDSVCFCLSKGLSAPVGSLLMGGRDFIAGAAVFRRMCGGNMRQSGHIAAAGIVALETMTGRLVEDHATCRKLWQRIRDLDTRLVSQDAPQTNILMVSFAALSTPLAVDWLEPLKKEGVKVNAFGRNIVRMVTHRHIGDREIDIAVNGLAACLKRLG